MADFFDFDIGPGTSSGATLQTRQPPPPKELTPPAAFSAPSAPSAPSVPSVQPKAAPRTTFKASPKASPKGAPPSSRTPASRPQHQADRDHLRRLQSPRTGADGQGAPPETPGRMKPAYAALPVALRSSRDVATLVSAYRGNLDEIKDLKALIKATEKVMDRKANELVRLEDYDPEARRNTIRDDIRRITLQVNQTRLRISRLQTELEWTQAQADDAAKQADARPPENQELLRCARELLACRKECKHLDRKRQIYEENNAKGNSILRVDLSRRTAALREVQAHVAELRRKRESNIENIQTTQDELAFLGVSIDELRRLYADMDKATTPCSRKAAGAGTGSDPDPNPTTPHRADLCAAPASAQGGQDGQSVHGAQDAQGLQDPQEARLARAHAPADIIASPDKRPRAELLDLPAEHLPAEGAAEQPDEAAGETPLFTEDDQKEMILNDGKLPDDAALEAADAGANYEDDFEEMSEDIDAKIRNTLANTGRKLLAHASGAAGPVHADAPDDGKSSTPGEGAPEEDAAGFVF